MYFDDIAPFVFGLLIAIVLAALGVFIYFAVQESIAWEKFATEHHCKVVHVGPNKLIPVTNTVNKVTVVTYMTVSGDKTWRCDNGRDYVR